MLVIFKLKDVKVGPKGKQKEIASRIEGLPLGLCFKRFFGADRNQISRMPDKLHYIWPDANDQFWSAGNDLRLALRHDIFKRTPLDKMVFFSRTSQRLSSASVRLGTPSASRAKPTKKSKRKQMDAIHFSPWSNLNEL